MPKARRSYSYLSLLSLLTFSICLDRFAPFRYHQIVCPHIYVIFFATSDQMVLSTCRLSMNYITYYNYALCSINLSGVRAHLCLGLNQTYETMSKSSLMSIYPYNVIGDSPQQLLFVFASNGCFMHYYRLRRGAL